jgi:hypothetical protein
MIGDRASFCGKKAACTSGGAQEGSLSGRLTADERLSDEGERFPEVGGGFARPTRSSTALTSG